MKREDLAIQIAAYYFTIAVIVAWFGTTLTYLIYKLIVKLIHIINGS